MLTKMVDGVTIECTPQEEANIRAFWALNEKYIEYVGHIGHDGLNAPNIDMDGARAKHLQYHEKSYALALADLSHQIEVAQENGKDVSLLLSQRKDVRAITPPDLTKAQNLDDLRAAVNPSLKPYWLKN
jgi:hypothetical protein